MENEKRAAQNRQEDTVLNRVLIWFGGAVAAEFLLLLINRFYINTTTQPGEFERAYAFLQILPFLIAALAVAAVLCGVWAFTLHGKRKPRGVQTALATVLLCLTAIFAVTFWFFAAGVQFLCGAVPVVAVLALVYYLYQREFFTVTVLSCMGILGLWILRRADGGHQTLVYGYMVAAVLVLTAVAVLARVLQKNNGVFVRGERKFHVLSRSVNYGVLYLTCAVVALVLIAACILGTAVAYYLIFALVAWLFVMAVYYTVKLM